MRNRVAIPNQPDLFQSQSFVKFLSISEPVSTSGSTARAEAGLPRSPLEDLTGLTIIAQRLWAIDRCWTGTGLVGPGLIQATGPGVAGDAESAMLWVFSRWKRRVMVPLQWPKCTGSPFWSFAQRCTVRDRRHLHPVSCDQGLRTNEYTSLFLLPVGTSAESIFTQDVRCRADQGVVPYSTPSPLLTSTLMMVGGV